MNTLGLTLLESIAHATGFAVVGMLAYLALRRLGPAAGSLAAGSSLLIMVLVAMVVLSPWPRWWTLAAEDLRVEAIELRAAAPPGNSSATRADAETSPSPPTAMPADSQPARPRYAFSAQPTLIAAMLGELRRELWRPATERDRARGSWPRWLAMGFFASLALGLARLGLGLGAIRRLRMRSRPIDDRELNDAVELLRAELGCPRRVDVRELAELATPATIGWRRPLLLLPGDWRDWSPAERRVVLAHELAHVHRGDFLAGLVGQLSLALQFYHPLAHWLAARLRLEQELAADAWGARLSGGTSSYLATLAQMALRRDGRAVTWPARAFLPSHGTFVRRIHMLRTSKSLRRVSLPVGARVLTVGVLAGLGLLVAGLRGPAGGSPAQAQDQPVARPPVAAAPAGDESYNLAFVPAEAKMVLAIRPGSLLRRRDVQAIVNSIRDASLLKGELVVPPEEIEQLLVFWEAEPNGAGPGPAGLVPVPSGMVLRMAKPQDWKAILEGLHGPAQEARHNGQTYFRASKPPLPGPAFAPDDRTLIHTRDEELLRELIEDRNAPAPHRSWDEAWKKVRKGQVMLALETRWLRRRIAQGMPGRAQAPGQRSDAMLKLETFSPLYENARSYAMGIDASDQGLTIDLVAAAGSERDAKPVAETLQAVMTLGKNAVQGLRRDSDLRRGEGLDWVLQAADSLLEKARVETSENFVHLRADSSINLAEGIRLLVPAVTTARAAARRKLSANNLKQIALAFHNYNSTYQHFPAAVNYGGKTKSVPYSWRVAILPFIEQQELYNQYNFDEPWDGPNNRKLLDKMPATYSYPGPDGTPSSRTNSAYFVFTGPSTALSVGPGQGAAGAMMTPMAAARRKVAVPDPTKGEAVPAGPGIMQITDGTSNTILAVEAQREIPWTKPEDIPFFPNGPMPELGGFTPDGFNAAFADGSVRYIKKAIKPNVLKALITRDGGEVISLDSF